LRSSPNYNSLISISMEDNNPNSDMEQVQHYGSSTPYLMGKMGLFDTSLFDIKVFTSSPPWSSPPWSSPWWSSPVVITSSPPWSSPHHPCGHHLCGHHLCGHHLCGHHLCILFANFSDDIFLFLQHLFILKPASLDFMTVFLFKA
jgi:hypothetical protein